MKQVCRTRTPAQQVPFVVAEPEKQIHYGGRAHTGKQGAYGEEDSHPFFS